MVKYNESADYHATQIAIAAAKTDPIKFPGICQDSPFAISSLKVYFQLFFLKEGLNQW